MEPGATDVGVFGAGSPYEGQRVTHRGSQFVIEGSGPVDAIALVAWADAGQLRWTSDAIGQWVQASTAPGSVPPPPTPPPPGEAQEGTTGKRRPAPALVTAIVVLLLLLGAVGAYLIGNHSPRTATTTTTGSISTEPASSTTSPDTVTTVQSTLAPTIPPTPAPTNPPTVAPTQPPAPADPVNNANYARIQIGMTLAQVEAILGGAGRLTDESSTFGDQYVWERTDGGYGNISIAIKDGVVFSKYSSIP